MFGFIASAAASLGSGILGSRASKDAARAQGDSVNSSLQMQREQFDAMREDLAPYRDAGTPAIQRLMYLTGVGSGSANDPEFGSLSKDFSLADFAKDPGYGFRQAEGEKSLERGAAARGLSASTPGLKSLMRFNQDNASSEYGAAYGRFREQQSNKFNLLSYLAGTGQNAAAMTGQAGVNMASSAAQTMMAGGNAQAAGAIGSASSWNNAIQGGLGNYMYQQRFDQLMKRMPVFGAANTAPAGPAMNWNSTGDFNMSATG